MRAGRQREDDRVEVKSQWPKPDKARQLAAAANALRGEPLIYIIGCAENGLVQALHEQDPESWHAQMSAAFDSEPPDLVMHASVPVGDAPGESVVALLFSTEQFPYVMPVPGQDRREVPIRMASGTVSANRRQLLRILAPSLAAPACEIQGARISAYLNEYPAVEANVELGNAPQPARTDLCITVQAQVFIEYVGSSSATIPAHSVRARVVAPNNDAWELRTRVHPTGGIGRDRPRPAPPRFGVYVSEGFVTATGPGAFSFQATAYVHSTEVPREQLEAQVAVLDAAEQLTLDVRLAFVAVERHSRVSRNLVASASEDTIGLNSWRRTWEPEAASFEW